MKKIFIAALALMTLCVSSCNRTDPQDPVYMAAALVTMRPQADGSFYMKATEETALVAINDDLKKYPFEDGKEHRALVQFTYDPEDPGTSVVPGYKTTQEVEVFTLDTILTKKPLVYEEEKDESYGKSMIGLYITDEVFPTTVVEDGYLTARMALPMGLSGVTHTVDLLTGVDPDDPYTVELRHNMHGDDYYDNAKALYCFPLKDLPDTEGKTVKLTIKWLSLVTGKTETAQFDYCTRTDW